MSRGKVHAITLHNTVCLGLSVYLCHHSCHHFCTYFGHSGLVVRHLTAVCKVLGLKPTVALCLAQQPLQYAALGMGYAPLLQCLNRLILYLLQYGKMSTGENHGKVRRITSAMWQVTLCDSIWQVISQAHWGFVLMTVHYTNRCILYFTLLCTLKCLHVRNYSVICIFCTTGDFCCRQRL